MNQVKSLMDSLHCQVGVLARYSRKVFAMVMPIKGMIAAIVLFLLAFSAPVSQSAFAAPFATTPPTVAYNIDFGMDLARIEQTIEHYGEEIREVVEQALLNNVNHPESKETAQNTYQRESALNELLPERRSSAFSKDDLTNLKKTEHPRDRLR